MTAASPSTSPTKPSRCKPANARGLFQDLCMRIKAQQPQSLSLSRAKAHPRTTHSPRDIQSEHPFARDLRRRFDPKSFVRERGASPRRVCRHLEPQHTIAVPQPSLSGIFESFGNFFGAAAFFVAFSPSLSHDLIVFMLRLNIDAPCLTSDLDRYRTPPTIAAEETRGCRQPHRPTTRATPAFVGRRERWMARCHIPVRARGFIRNLPAVMRKLDQAMVCCRRPPPHLSLLHILTPWVEARAAGCARGGRRQSDGARAPATEGGPRGRIGSQVCRASAR